VKDKLAQRQLNDQSSYINNSYVRNETHSSNLTQEELTSNDTVTLANISRYKIESDSDSEIKVILYLHRRNSTINSMRKLSLV